MAHASDATGLRPIEDFLFAEDLPELDPETDLLCRGEADRETEKLVLIASESICPPAVRRAPFEIAWRGGSWNRDPDEIEDEVHFLFESESEKSFQAMGPGAREAALDRFWLERDPDPGTGENEARSAFLARIEHANRQWTRAGIGKGMYSDMGRTFIRHGEPDEILRQVQAFAETGT